MVLAAFSDVIVASEVGYKFNVTDSLWLDAYRPVGLRYLLWIDLGTTVPSSLIATYPAIVECASFQTDNLFKARQCNEPLQFMCMAMDPKLISPDVQCKCLSGICAGDGRCELGIKKCAWNWFGEKCQFRNLAMDAHYLPELDGDPLTCNEESYTHEVTLTIPTTFAWMQMLFKDSGDNVTFSTVMRLQQAVVYEDVTRLDIENKQVTLTYDLRSPVDYINITWSRGIGLCEVVLNGAVGGGESRKRNTKSRNLAFNGNADIVVGHDTLPAPDTVDGARMTLGACLSSRDQKFHQWFISFHTEFYVFDIYIYGLSGSKMTLSCYDGTKGKVAGCRVPPSVYSNLTVYNLEAGTRIRYVRLGLDVTDGLDFVNICEVEIYGDCSGSHYGLDCNRPCSEDCSNSHCSFLGACKNVTGNNVMDNDVAGYKVADNKVTGNKATDNKVKDNIVTGNKVKDNIVTDNNAMDNSVTDNKVTNNKVTDNKVTDVEQAAKTDSNTIIKIETSTPGTPRMRLMSSTSNSRRKIAQKETNAELEEFTTSPYLDLTGAGFTSQTSGPITSEECSTEWYGPQCQHRCHCSFGGCNKDGACAFSDTCAHGWFGYNCQYRDMTPADQSLPSPLTDNNLSTCIVLPGGVVSIRWEDSFAFTWLRLVVFGYEYGLDIEYPDMNITYLYQEEGSPSSAPVTKCNHAITKKPEIGLVDLECFPYTRIQAMELRVSGGIKICSLHISGGRNMVTGTPIFFNATSYSDEPMARLAVDGDLSGETCAVSPPNSTNASLTIVYARPVMISDISVRIGSRMDTKSTIYIKVYDNEGGELAEYAIYPPLAKSNRVTIKHTLEIFTIVVSTFHALEICELEAFGECALGLFGSECNEICLPECAASRCRYDGTCYECPAGRVGTYCTEAEHTKQLLEKKTGPESFIQFTASFNPLPGGNSLFVFLFLVVGVAVLVTAYFGIDTWRKTKSKGSGSKSKRRRKSQSHVERAHTTERKHTSLAPKPATPQVVTQPSPPPPPPPPPPPESKIGLPSNTTKTALDAKSVTSSSSSEKDTESKTEKTTQR